METAAAAPASAETITTTASVAESGEGSQEKSPAIHSVPTEAPPTPDSQSDISKATDTSPEKELAVEQSTTSPASASTAAVAAETAVDEVVKALDDDQTANAALSDQVNIAHYLSPSHAIAFFSASSFTCTFSCLASLSLEPFVFTFILPFSFVCSLIL